MIYLKKFIGKEATRNDSLRVRTFLAIATPRSSSDDAERVVGQPETIQKRASGKPMDDFLEADFWPGMTSEWPVIRT